MVRACLPQEGYQSEALLMCWSADTFDDTVQSGGLLCAGGEQSEPPGQAKGAELCREQTAIYEIQRQDHPCCAG